MSTKKQVKQLEKMLRETNSLMKMKPFTTQAHIHSLNGEMKEITVLYPETLFGNTIQNSYVVQYEDIKCTAVFNPFTNQFYADDKYGIIKDE